MNSPNWLAEALNNPKITDICINGSAGVFIDQGRGMETLPGTWTDDLLRQWVLEQISKAGKSWDARHPFIDAMLETGHRLHVAFPPLAKTGILVSLRRIPQPGDREGRWGPSAKFAQLARVLEQGDSMVISGATGSGKTTLLTDLLSYVPLTERIIALEDTPEICPTHPHFLALTSRPPNADGCGEVTLRTLLKQALRMRPDRIILGECRGNEVLDLLQTLNTGHKGTLATLHANSARDALRRLELLCLLASGGAIPIGAIRELMSVGIQWVVQVRRIGATREISEIWKLEGREGDTLLMRPMLNS